MSGGKEYRFIASFAYQIIDGCEACGGNVLFVVGLSREWVCVDCRVPMQIVLPEPDDSRMDVYKEFIDKLG